MFIIEDNKGKIFTSYPTSVVVTGLPPTNVPYLEFPFLTFISGHSVSEPLPSSRGILSYPSKST